MIKTEIIFNRHNFSLVNFRSDSLTEKILLTKFGNNND